MGVWGCWAWVGGSGAYLTLNPKPRQCFAFDALRAQAPIGCSGLVTILGLLEGPLIGTLVAYGG